MKKTRFMLLAVLSSAVLCTPFVVADIDRQDTLVILDAMRDTRPDSFNAFLDELRESGVAANLGDPDTVRAIERFRSGESITQGHRNDVIRLLGIYTQLRYADDAVQTLTDLVAIRTFNVEAVPQYENPEFLRFAAALEVIATQMGLSFRNVDDRIYEISLDHNDNSIGVDRKLIGLHAHADVVPVNPELWVLEDGTRLDPFVVTRIGNRMYGRGTEDDKNGIVAVMYAMKVVHDENLPVLHDFRLLIDTTEETSGEAIPYYFERNPVPDFNIALDGGYPVVIAEKGYGTVMASFPARSGSGEGAEMVGLVGGLATNQIPATASATFISRNPEQLVAMLNEAGAIYASANGSDFGVRARTEGELVRLDVLGVSAHSSEPETGLNPVSRLLHFVYQLHGQGVLQSNHFTDAARYATENWGLDDYGKNLEIAYADDFMGPLTATQTFVAVNAEQLRTAVNLRLPIGRDPDDLLADIRGKLYAWASSAAVDVAFDLSVGAPMYRNPEGAWVNSLLDIAVENLDLPRQFGSSAGGTSIHDLPNGVQFGLAMPDQKYTGHNANEFKTIDQFLLDLRIVTEMIGRLGGMAELQAQ